MGRCARWARDHARALALTAAIVALVGLLIAVDQRLGLHRLVNTRYRFHAIPVAISVLYHHHPHDYTAARNLAMRFHDPERSIDDQIREAASSDADLGDGTYYWVADDRGLADFALGAFWCFGARAESLSAFWFLLLSLSLLLYVIGFWRTPAALTLPPLILLGWVAIASVAFEPLPFPNARGSWGEEIALFESRMFDALACVAVLHLAILGGTRLARCRAAWLTAVPQAALLILLYHARSSLGWQYLALASLAAVRVGWCVLNRRRAPTEPRAQALASPLLVLGILAASLIGLKQYQRTVYHPHYAKTYGQRTFWHNALMGLAFHSRLRDDLPMAHCDDRNAVDLVLARMEAIDPALDKNVWNWQAALNSLGNHNRFDWSRYEAAARRIYIESWQTHPREMAECHLYSKPRDMLPQARVIADRLARGMWRGAMPEFLAAIGLTALVLAGAGAAARRDLETASHLRSLTRILAFLIPFSLIPGIAFYPALTTVACFYLLSVALLGVLIVRITVRLLPRVPDRGVKCQ
jgi:hypothetical protein